MKIFLARFRWSPRFGVFAFVWLSAIVAQTATLSNFGYRSMGCVNNVHMTASNNLAFGQRPMIVIVAQFDDVGTLNHDITYYSNFVFNAEAMSPKQSLNGYFDAVSNGRFSWIPGAVIGPIHLGSSDRWNSIRTLLGIMNDDYNYLVDNFWASNVVSHAMLSNRAAFEGCDKDGNGWDTQDEVQVVIFSNEDALINGGHYHAVGYRGCNEVPASPHCNVGWAGQLAEFVDWTDFSTACHEVSHCLGTEDIYPPSGYENEGLSVMGGTGGSNDMTVCYLDPWHRMRAGWCEPRIYDMTVSSNVWISAAQTGNPTTPVILWNPDWETSTFWIVEFRNPNLGGYDRNAASTRPPFTNGLALWFVQQKADHTLNTKNFNYQGGTITYRFDLNCGPPYAINYPLEVYTLTLWGSDAITRNLSDLSGRFASVPITVHIDPFSSTANSLHIEWGNNPIWVDFANNGIREDGSFTYPFNTFTEGVTAVIPHGTNIIRAGRSPETLRVTKPVRLQSANGTATIGR